MIALVVTLYFIRSVLSFLIRVPAAVLFLAGGAIWKLADWVGPAHSCEEGSPSDQHRPSVEILVIPDRVFRKMIRRGAVSAR
jgi:hypothetical protein